MNEQNYTPNEAADAKKPAVSRKLVVFIFLLFFIPALAGSFLPFILTWSVLSKDLKQANPKGCTETVYAVVCRNDTREEYDEDTGHYTEYRPVFQYKYNGSTYEVESEFTSSSPQYKVGEELELKLDPADPTHIYVPGSRSIVIVAYLLTLLFPAGVIFAAIVIAILLHFVLPKVKVN